MIRKQAVKLVRDFIPALAARQGRKLLFDIAPPSKLYDLFVDKLAEEAQELVDAQTLAEMLDRMAGVYELLELAAIKQGLTMEEIAKAADLRNKIKGGFRYGFILCEQEPEETVPHEVTVLPNGYQLRHHMREECQGHHCPLHNPSNHVLKDAPLLWRNDRGLMERMCEHGVGHPDPDDLNYKAMMLGQDTVETEGVHGCCGCCS
jgi:predicted house-cleaning noncanonical NTP pyrophosphatase (MazG superfamily)